jgi:hypothetical protein
MRRRDGVQQGWRHRPATKGKTSGLARATEGTGQNCRDAQIETPHAPSYRAGICTTLLREISLRRAVGQIDRIFVRLREIRRRMSDNEYETARLERAGQSRLGRGIGAGLRAEGSCSRKDIDRDSEGSEAGMWVLPCAHNPRLRS